MGRLPSLQKPEPRCGTDEKGEGRPASIFERCPRNECMPTYLTTRVRAIITNIGKTSALYDFCRMKGHKGREKSHVTEYLSGHPRAGTVSRVIDLFAFFRRKPPIADPAALAEFIDGHAAFLVQKGIYEYSRARAGHYSKVLFREKTFQDAIEGSRWRAFPLGLAMVAEAAE